MERPTPVISLNNATKTYDGATALDAVTLDINAGEFVCVVGPSGSGKSTLLRLIHRSEVATSGTVAVAGRDLATLRGRDVPRLRRRVAHIFQDFKLLGDRTVAANVAFALEVTGHRLRDVTDRVDAALSVVGLDGKAGRLPTELSGGEQQRVAIARAVASRPLVILADEPTGNLDPATSGDIVDLLSRVSQAGTTVVMVTHDRSTVDRLRPRVVGLSAGVVVRDDHGGGYGS